MSMSHIFILIIIAVIVVPPEKLPDFARQIARFINDLRRSTTGVWDDIKKDAMVKPEDLLKHQNAAPVMNTDSVPKSETTSEPADSEKATDEVKKHES